MDQFEYTPECIVFDLLRIPLYHGWVVDPQNVELRQLIQSNAPSYNQLVEKMLRQRQSNRDDLLREGRIDCGDHPSRRSNRFFRFVVGTILRGESKSIDGVRSSAIKRDNAKQ